jgi:hypothetical protein
MRRIERMLKTSETTSTPEVEQVEQAVSPDPEPAVENDSASEEVATAEDFVLPNESDQKDTEVETLPPKAKKRSTYKKKGTSKSKQS